MSDRLRLPRPHIATKLYGAIALTLAVVYLLAGATIHYAGRTEETIERLRVDGLRFVLQSGRLQLALERQRRLIDTALLPADPASREQDERTFGDLTAAIADAMRTIGYGWRHALANQYADLAQKGALTLAYARDERLYEVRAMAAEYAQEFDAFAARLEAEHQARTRAVETELEEIAVGSHAIATWVSAAAAFSGLIIGPIGLFLLRRVLFRLEGIGAALVRLARNDTSVDIPDLDHEDEVGQLARSVAVFKSKSIELLQKKAELERLNLQLDAAVNNMPLGLSMFDAQQRLLVCNRRYAEMYELPSELVRPGTPHCALWSYREKKGARHFPDEEGRALDLERPTPLIIEYGTERVISVSRQPLKGVGWLSLHEDITLRRRQEQEITHLARHDVLTNLANRSLFREQLQQALLRLRRGQGFAVFCIDLDRFKPVNDTLGHPVGDALLRQVSERLLACVRQGDLVARLGGDEFAIIEANVRDAESSEKLALRIVEAIGKPFDVNGNRIEISCSIGITLAPRDGSDADELLKHADLALYRTKADGRNGYSFFRPEMADHMLVRRTLESDLKKALEEDGLALSYQPIVTVGDRKVVGFEALMRWTHPSRGTIPPAEFIALAEESGLMAEIGEWSLYRACAHAARWPAAVRVAINLSPLQMKRDLIEIVLQALANSGLPPDRLEIEITEAVLMQDSQNTLATLHQLRQLGVRIVMDNFGRGYCSLSYLRSFPFDKIKVDRALVADMDRSEEARALVGSIIGLGNNLGMVTVAEGVESAGQLDAVAALGCAEAQGFYFSPAVPAAEVERVLADFAGVRDAA